MRFCCAVVLCAIFLTTLPSRSLARDIYVDAVDDAEGPNETCTLRKAIDAANWNIEVDGCEAGDVGLDVIHLDAGDYTLSQAGSMDDDNLAGDLDVKEALIIEGVTSATTTLSWLSTADRLIDVRGVAFTLRNVSLTGGRAPSADTGQDGGAIRAASNSDITIESCTFNDNYAGDATAELGHGGNGGAIAVGENSTLAVSSSYFEGNVAGASGTATSYSGPKLAGNGGAIFAGEDSVVSITLSIFKSNVSGQAQYHDEHMEWHCGNGGAIEASSAASLSVSYTTFRQNSAGTAAFMGTVLGDGGAIYAMDAPVRIDAVLFDGNTSDVGGGVYGDAITGVNVTCSGNVSRMGACAFATDGGYAKLSFVTAVSNIGGALAARESATFTYKAAILSENLRAGGTSTDFLDCDFTDATYVAVGYGIVGSVGGCDGNYGTVVVEGALFGLILYPTLEDNGGPTKTHAIHPDNPVPPMTFGCTDADDVRVMRDQRGAPRDDDYCTGGAFEQFAGYYSCESNEYKNGVSCAACSTCDNGYVTAACAPNADTQCGTCAEGCGACTASGATDCTACTSGYFFVGGECQACANGCATCTGTAETACLTCERGFFLQGGACHACTSCPGRRLALCSATADTVCSPIITPADAGVVDAHVADADDVDADVDAEVADATVVDADSFDAAHFDADAVDAEVVALADASLDSGLVLDAASAADASGTNDATIAVDAAADATVDAATTVDAFVPSDASAARDANVAMLDAHVEPDAAVDGGTSGGGGCDCAVSTERDRASNAYGFLLAAAAIAMALRRARRAR